MIGERIHLRGIDPTCAHRGEHAVKRRARFGMRQSSMRRLQAFRKTERAGATPPNRAHLVHIKVAGAGAEQLHALLAAAERQGQSQIERIVGKIKKFDSGPTLSKSRGDCLGVWVSERGSDQNTHADFCRLLLIRLCLHNRVMIGGPVVGRDVSAIDGAVGQRFHGLGICLMRSRHQEWDCARCSLV